MINYPVLALPIPEGEYIVDTDASNKSLGAVLQQKQNGIARVISYASRVLDPAERSYCTTRKELLRIIFALKCFRHYLLSVPFLLRTDHAALTSLLRIPEPVGQQARWLDLLAEYQFRIEHRSGKLHSNLDSLSQRPCGSRKCVREDCMVSTCDGLKGANVLHRQKDAGKTFPLRLGRIGTRKNSTPTERSMHSTKPDIHRSSAKNQRSTTVPSAADAHVLSLGIVKKAQRNDPVLQQIRMLLNESEWRTQVEEMGMGFVHLWSQRDNLIVVKDIIHRKFEKADGEYIANRYLSH